jgi:hypothetical protein
MDGLTLLAMHHERNCAVKASVHFQTLHQNKSPDIAQLLVLIAQGAILPR